MEEVSVVDDDDEVWTMVDKKCCILLFVVVSIKVNIYLFTNICIKSCIDCIVV